MSGFLLRLFVKDYQNTSSPSVRTAIGKLSGLVGIICNFILFLSKLITGLVIGSLSVVADSVNNLSDAASSVITLLGFKLAQQPADKDHPYGHARYEYLSGLVVAVLVLIIGAELAETSVRKIIAPEGVSLSVTAFVVLFLSIGIKLWMTFFFGSLGKRIDSTALRATGVDCRNDVIVSSAVLAGCAFEHFTKINIDGYVGLLVALFILYSGIGIVRETVSPLLGQQADRQLVEAIRQLVLSHDKVLGIHDLLVHDYGPGRWFASAHAELDATEDPLLCHDIIDHIERDALTKLNVHLVIHYDPVTVNDESWNKAREIMNEIISRIHPDISMHDFRIKRGSGGKALIFDLLIPYSADITHEEIKESIDTALKEKGLDFITIINFDSGM